MLQTIKDFFTPSPHLTPQGFEIEDDLNKLVIEVKDGQIIFHNTDFGGWCITGDSGDIERLQEYLRSNL